jgi:cysteine desulfurase
MLQYFKDYYANASSTYKLARNNHRDIENARKTISSLLNVSQNEIYFTSGATESNNWVIQSLAKQYIKEGKNHIITSSIEHLSILNTVKELENNGFQVTYLKVDKTGCIDIDELKSSITDKTFLVSIMYANNEIGTIQPINKIGQICQNHHILFHCDAVSVIGKLPIDIKKDHIDFLSASAHKFYGPKGIGFLYKRKGIKLKPLLYGGNQEFGVRAGTQNVPYIIAMATALKESYEFMNNHTIKQLRDYIETSLSKIDGIHFNGNKDNRLDNILNLSFEDIDGESLLFELDLKGIIVSTGSACHYGLSKTSHVLLALGINYPLAQGSIRISLGRYNTKEDADKIIKAIKESLQYLNHQKYSF